LEVFEKEEGELVELDEVEVCDTEDEDPDEPASVTVTVFGVVSELLPEGEGDEEAVSLCVEVVHT